MTTAIGKTGGCQCGRIRYRLQGEPRTLYACHCRDCQKQSASAFGMSLIVAAGDLQWTDGADLLRTWDTRGGDGTVKRCAFCPECGTRLYHGSQRPDDLVSLKAGSLDDTGWLEPVAHIWLERAQPWVEADAEKYACFAREPGDRDELERRWRERGDAG